MEKELLLNTYDQPQHKIMRKNSRSPSLRLRFGRRSDPLVYQVDINVLNPSFNITHHLIKYIIL